MKPIKQTTRIITITLVGMFLLVSCSKTEEPQAKGGKKGQKASAAAKTPPPPSLTLDKSKNPLTATRSGQYVDLNWHIETLPANKITRLHIIRSSTGGLKQSVKVAELDSKAGSFKDSLPDGNAQWYWVRIIVPDGSNPLIGPVRVERDTNQSAQYIKPEDDYKAVVTRTENAATLSWDFPEANFKTITISRRTRPTPKPSPVGSTQVTTSLECRAQYADPLPDSNADYWYWFKITTKSGGIIHKGPIKAEYN